MRTLSLSAYSLLAIAVIAWGAVFFESSWLLGSASDRAQSAASSEQMSEKLAYAARLSALAADTKDERAQVEAMVRGDVVAIANTLEAVGKNAGVGAKVSDALPENGATALPGGGAVQPIAFIVQTQGTFQALMRAAALYERLALPSQIEQLDMEKSGSGDAKSAPWRMTLRIRVLTSAIITS